MLWYVCDMVLGRNGGFKRSCRLSIDVAYFYKGIREKGRGWIYYLILV
jgi:hypothetical protein